jgi:hypothetical protein
MQQSVEKMVLEHLKKHGSITSYDAIKLFGATRLSALIYNLRYKGGYNISTTFEAVVTRYGRKTQIARYVLKERVTENE